MTTSPCNVLSRTTSPVEDLVPMETTAEAAASSDPKAAKDADCSAAMVVTANAQETGLQRTTSEAATIGQRRGIIVGKGINAFFTPEYVRGQIESQLNFNLRNVRTFQRDPKNATTTFHWWVITTDTKDQLQEVIKQNNIAGCHIRWDPYMQRGVQQCYNCQGYQHIARNCTNAKKCVKCNEQHGPNECRAPKFERGTGNKHLYYCVNCECHGHPANGRECPIRQAEEQRAEQQRNNPPTAEDFNIPRKKQYGAPTPIDLTNMPPKRTHWENFNDKRKERENNDWKELCDMTKLEFGRTPGQMMRLCRDFIVANQGRTREESKEALFHLYMELAQY